MKKSIAIAILGIGLLVTSGCANGPVRQFFRGGSCNSCTPWLGSGLFNWNNADADCCPTCDQGISDVAPGTGFIQPDGQLNVDPYSGGTVVDPTNGQNMGILPRPR